MGELHSDRKIALIDMALPVLRSLSRLEYERFVGITRWLIVSEGMVNLFEFMLQRVVERHLVSHFESRGFGRVRFKKLSQFGREANVLVSTMAGIASSDREVQKRAYLAATTDWDLSKIDPRGFSPPQSLKEVGEALNRFEQASPIVQREILKVCGRAAVVDGELTSREAELLRTIADAIGRPIPPFIEVLQEVEI